jgi:hypothetical protein
MSILSQARIRVAMGKMNVTSPDLNVMNPTDMSQEVTNVATRVKAAIVAVETHLDNIFWTQVAVCVTNVCAVPQ